MSARIYTGKVVTYIGYGAGRSVYSPIFRELQWGAMHTHVNMQEDETVRAYLLTPRAENQEDGSIDGSSWFVHSYCTAN